MTQIGDMETGVPGGNDRENKKRQTRMENGIQKCELV